MVYSAMFRRKEVGLSAKVFSRKRPLHNHSKGGYLTGGP